MGRNLKQQYTQTNLSCIKNNKQLKNTPKKFYRFNDYSEAVCHKLMMRSLIPLHQSTAASTWWCDPVWVGSKWLLAFPRVPVTPGTPLHFFAMLPPERPQKGSTQILQNRLPVFTFSLPLPFSFPSSSPYFSPSLDER